MPKRIVFCSDGTWQNQLSNTNVYRLYKALLVNSEQVTLYDDGVGADAAGLDRFLQGAFGQGLIQKIQDAYTKIAHIYAPGDQLYLFGFSRGAYTVRSLAGMIAACGLPTGDFTDDCAIQAFRAYRDKPNRATILAAAGACNFTAPTITMIGAWDTVGSLGIPAIFGQIDQSNFGFLDTSLSPKVNHAVHLLAIDEARAQFPATLWDPLPAPTPGTTPTQTLEQIWFAGCHGDIGGGVPLGGGVDDTTRLSDITLGYMVAKAKEYGLTFDPAIDAQYSTLPAKYALDTIHESWKPVAGPPHRRPIPDDATIANSVAVRIQYALTYQPPNLTIADNCLADAYTQATTVDLTAL